MTKLVHEEARMSTTTPIPAATGDVGTILKTAEERRATLDRTLQLWGAKGWRIETRSEFQATIAKGKEINNLLHLFLTIITLGIWLIFWLGLGIVGGVKRRMITVDEFGNIVEQKI
jgi:hypothetical protein